MQEFLQIAAILSATLFAGAAAHISIAEHPARMVLHPAIALAQWAPSYRRALCLQAPLALISSLSAAGVWLLGGNLAWLMAALLIGSVVPYTVLGITPTNRRLVYARMNAPSESTRPLLRKWAYLQATGTVASLLAIAVMSYGFGYA